MQKGAFIVAAMLSLVGAAMLVLYKQRFEENALGGNRVPVVVSTADLPIGTRLRPEHIATREIPEAFVERRHIRAAEARSIIGVRLGSSLQPSEALLWSDLATTTSESRNLAGLVRVGMRAVSIPATRQSAFSGLLRPGDRVDAFLTATSAVTGDRMTVPLAQNLLILAVGDDIGGAAGRASGSSAMTTVSLAVDIQQAQELTLASDRGAITLALRNPDDIRLVDDLPGATTTTAFPRLAMTGSEESAAQEAARKALQSAKGSDEPADQQSATRGDDAADDEQRARSDEEERKERKERKERRRRRGGSR